MIEHWCESKATIEKSKPGIKVLADGTATLMLGDDSNNTISVAEGYRIAALMAPSGNQQDGSAQGEDPSINAFSRTGQAGRQAGHAGYNPYKKGDGKKGNRAPAKSVVAPEGPKCSECGGYHNDVRSCPKRLALQDKSYSR